jgi:hypothetical protein
VARRRTRIDLSDQNGRVRIAGEQMWSLLRELDDPDHLETPADFDFEATRDRFEQLVSGLDTAFDCQSDADRSVQDATLHARVAVPAEATATGERLVVRVSNFGSLATASLENPGAYDTAELKTLLAAEDAARVYKVLDDLGYVVVPEEPLWRDYDGSVPLSVFAPQRPSWWIRYFDYL